MSICPELHTKYSLHNSNLSEAASRSQGADGIGSRQGSTGQRFPARSKRSRQEAEGLRRGEESQRCDHVSGEETLPMLRSLCSFF